MAGVTLSHGVGEQVALIAGLRFRLFRNSLRTWRGRLELIALVLLVALTALGAAGIGFGLGAGAFLFLSEGRVESLAWLLWIVFICWQVVPVVLAGFVAEFDFRNLLHFPLRFSTFVLLSLVYGLFDPAAVVAIFWTLCIGAGIFLARVELLAPALVVLAVFMGVNLLLSRLFLSWLERVLARRRTREAFLVIFLIAIGSVQLLFALAERWADWVKPLVAMLRTVVHVLPPNLAGHALAGTAGNDTAKAAVATGLLAAWGLGFGFLLRRRLHAQYLGADTGEGAPRAGPTAEQVVQQGWHLPGLSTAVSALCEKELRYAVRNGQTILSLILPLIVTVFFAWLWSAQQTFLSRIPQELFFPSAVAYAFLTLAPLMHNTFGYDGRGIQMLLLAPLSFERVLLAKNLVHGLLVAFEAGLIWFLVSVLQAPPSVRILAATLAALLFMTLVHFTAGNLLSLYFPRRLEFGRVRRRPSEVTVLMGYFIQVLVIGSVGLIFYKTHTGPPAEGGWLGTVLFLALSAAALALYVVMLDRCAQIASDRREVLTAELCR